MGRKIYVTAQEMLQLREQGMSNHDIAKSLDISYATVVRYIGRQDGHMEGLAAFKDTPPRKEEKEPEVHAVTHYEAKPVVETFSVSKCRIILDHENRCVVIDDEIMLPYDRMPDIVQFLVWAMRTRMEVNPDGEEDQQQGEGCAV
jgi:predicted transcriptional regulator